MNRLDAVQDRLPPTLNVAAGSVLHQLLAVAANQLTAYDEDVNRVQRSHWLATAFDREDLGRLGALFDLAMAPWEPERLYRDRLQATVAARLRGAVTREALETVLILILRGAQDALGVRYLDLTRARTPFRTGATAAAGEGAFVEFPPVTRRSPALAERRGLLRSLDKVGATNRGLEPVPLRGVIRGAPGHRTQVPVLVNLTNGTVLAYLGELACGQELRLEVDPGGRLTATVSGADVLDRVFTATGFTPGSPFSPLVPQPSPQPIRLERGDNRLWCFPLAVFDQQSLGSAVLGMPAVDLEHGRFGAAAGAPDPGTRFNHSLFEQAPAVSLDLWWTEAQPAAFRFEIPAGVVAGLPGPGPEAALNRDRLFRLLQQTVDLLRAAGVHGRVEPRPLRDAQAQRDRLRLVPPVLGREAMPLEDRLRALSALFDTSAVDGSRFS